MPLFELSRGFHAALGVPNKKQTDDVSINFNNSLSSIFQYFEINPQIVSPGRNDLYGRLFSKYFDGIKPLTGAGISGQFANFDATAGIVLAPDSSGGASTSFSTTDFTFFCRVKLLTRDGDGRNVFFDMRTPGDLTGLIFHAENSLVSNGIRFFNGQSGTGFNSSAGVLPLNKYVTLGFSHKGTAITMFADGKVVGTGTDSTGVNLPNNFLPLFMRESFSTSVDKNCGEVVFGAYHPNYGCTVDEGIRFSKDPYQILKPKTAPVYFTASVAGGVTVNLTGQESTLSQGALTITGAASFSLAGQSATFSQGTITVDISAAVTVNLTGQAATFSQGALSALGFASVSLSGQASTFSQGSLAVTGEALLSLSGQQITANQGTIAVSVGGAINVILSSQQMAASQGVIAAAGKSIVSIIGQEVTSAQGAITVSITTTPTVINLSTQAITSNIGIIGLQTANVITLSGLGVALSQGNLSVVAGGWTIQPDNPAIWAQQSDESTTWTIQ